MQSEGRRIANQMQRVQTVLRAARLPTDKPSAAKHAKPGANGKAPDPSRDARGPDPGSELNAVLVEEVMSRVLQTQRILDGHHARLRWTYATYMVLAVLMFLAGLALLFWPLMDKGNPETVDLVLAGVGGAELVALLIFSPFQRIQGMMGDMTQVILLMEGYLHQVALRLLQCRIKDPDSVGAAAGYIYVTTKETARLIQEYFENAPGSVTSGLLARKRTRQRLADDANALRGRLDELARDPVGAVEGVADSAAEKARGAGHAAATTVRRVTGPAGTGG